MKITDILYLSFILNFAGIFLSFQLNDAIKIINFILLFGIQLVFMAILIIKSKRFIEPNWKKDVKK